MTDARKRRAVLNILISLGCQAITLLCGFITPRYMLRAFGSEINGATASITQFLGYIALLEGGIGGVARAVLYKPLAENNIEKISKIIAEVKHYFRVLAFIFLPYVLILALGFKSLSHIEVLDWFSTAALVIVISLSTFAQYFIGISYSIFLQAAQKTYITQIISILATILNTIVTVVLVTLRLNIIIVKLFSSCVFVLRPICLMLYVKRHYHLISVPLSENAELKQKWSGLGQHLAYFLHSNTDVAILTLFGSLKAVSVYSIYYMIVAHLQSITVSFSTGMEAIFGDMLARREMNILHNTFGYYEILISLITNILFSTASVLLIPFIRVYTSNINDANYIEPIFGLILLISSAIYCLRMPYHSMIIAAGHFKQTEKAAYGEAIINIGISLLLVHKFRLIGIAVGTLIATCFRFTYYAIYLSNNIFNRPIRLLMKRLLVDTLSFVVILFVGKIITSYMSINNYQMWLIVATVVFLISLMITLIFNFAFYKNDSKVFIQRMMKHKQI
ncbi:MAG: polysaccharide biosynthesis C-terminal domain-containing protein [Erysipelotrichaceae bacterium]|nr:polysaccharide biosynthesis C-terminal domain-containing protein [Erysipelotrichaceae bacterium]